MFLDRMIRYRKATRKMPPAPHTEEVQSGRCLCWNLRSWEGTGSRADLTEDLLNAQMKDMNEEHFAVNKNYKVKPNGSF